MRCENNGRNVNFSGIFRESANMSANMYTKITETARGEVKRARVYKNYIYMINIIRDKDAKTSRRTATREGLPITIICAPPIIFINLRSSFRFICCIP